MKWCFFIFSKHGDALADTEFAETHPLGGSETAALHMVAALRRIGDEVTIVTRLEDVPAAQCDVFVNLRTWQIFQDGPGPGRINYLWCHDGVGNQMLEPLRDSAVAERVYGRADRVIVLSRYMAGVWSENFNLPANKIFLSSNGIPFDRFSVDPESIVARPRRAYYSSVPYMGLEFLLKAWPIISEAVPQSELHVFSSVKVYESVETEEFKRLYAEAERLPGVTYRGSVGQSELREEIKKSRVLAYPCIVPETSCITAMEAMAGGAAVASTAIGAMPETAWRNALVAPDRKWLENWIGEVVQLLVDDDYYLDLAKQNVAVARLYDWSLVAQKWRRRARVDLAKR